MRKSNKRLVFWLPAINPYWAFRLSALARESNVDFECWFNGQRGAGREWIVDAGELAFRHRFLSANPIVRYCQAGRRYIAYRPSHVLTFHFDSRLWPALIQRLAGRRLAFYVEKTWESWVHRSPMKELAKKLIFHMATDIFTPGADAERYVRRYSGNVAFRTLPHSIDIQWFSRGRRDRPADPVTFLYLGRFIREKGIGNLLDACEVLGREGRDFRMLFVGGGEMYEEISAWGSRQPFDVDVRPYIQTRDVPAVMAEADVLVFPTLGDPYGLVVDEAMAAGLPVISSRYAGEIEERLVSGPQSARGVIYEGTSADDRTRALTACISSVIDGDSDIRRMSIAAEDFEEDRGNVIHWVDSIESWVDSGRGRRVHSSSGRWRSRIMLLWNRTEAPQV